MLRSKEGPNQLGPIFPTLYIYFVQFFYLIKYSLRDPHYICPRFFIFATPFCDSHSRPHYATPLVTPIRDSRSRLPIAPPTATHYFLSQLPSCDSTTDRRTVSTPQRHLPSVPTLTLLKTFFLEPSPGLASNSSYYPPSCPPPLVALGLLTHPLAHYLLQRPLPLLPGLLPTSPPLLPPLSLPPFLLYGNMSLMY